MYLHVVSNFDILLGNATEPSDNQKNSGSTSLESGMTRVESVSA